MGGYQFPPKQCQVENCNIPVPVKESYCAKHTQGKGLPKPTPVVTSTSTHTTMAPLGEKLGDAITVKTPLPPLGPLKENEKKQLSDKKTARKTTSSSRPKQSPSTTRTSDSRPFDHRPSFDRVPVNSSQSDQRPPKKPRLSNNADRVGIESQHRVSSFPDNTSHSSSTFKQINAENCRVPVDSDFALRPKKENPNSLEIPIRHEGQDPSTTKRTHNPQIPKQQDRHNNARNNIIPAGRIIDLTQDDEPRPQFSGNVRQGPPADTRKDRARPTAEPNARVEQVISNLPHEGKSIEVQTTLNRETVKSNLNVRASNQEGNRHTHKADPSLASHLPPNRVQNIAPHVVNASHTPDFRSGPRPSQSTLESEKPKAPQCHKNPELVHGRLTDVSRQNGTQAQQPLPTSKLQGAINLSLAVDTHTPNKPAVSSQSTRSDQSSTNGYRAGPMLTSSTQTNNVVHGIIEDAKKTYMNKVNGARGENQACRSDSLLSHSEPTDVANRTYRSQSKESNIPKTQGIPEPRVAGPEPLSAPSSHDVAPKLPLPVESANSAENHGVKTPVANLIVEPSLGSLIRDKSWKCSKPEEERQSLISKHDPKKFDSYIYSKSNEPFRPGSALFGLPSWQQPPRSIRPATHFAHIDPRVHWSHSRSAAWHREKRKEIRERGNRKDNFGKAAARAAKRKRDQAEGHCSVDLPERVKSNSQWLAAIDELDEMEEQFHAQKREDFKRRKGCREPQAYPREIHQREEGKLVLVDEDGDCEMADNPFDRRNTPKVTKYSTWSYVRPS